MKLIQKIIDDIVVGLIGHPEEESPGKTMDYTPLIIIGLLVVALMLHVHVMLIHPVAQPITYTLIVVFIGRKAFLERTPTYHEDEL